MGGFVKLQCEALTCCDVAADGNTVSLGFEEAAGGGVSLQLSLAQASALAMTLPGLIERALRRQFDDPTLRYTYPLQSWVVEQSPDPRVVMMTLRTVDGFSVCFSMPTTVKCQLGTALAAPPMDISNLIN